MLVFDGVIMMEVTHQKTKQVAARLSGQETAGFYTRIIGFGA